MDQYRLAEANRRKIESTYHRNLSRIIREIRQIFQRSKDPQTAISQLESYANSDSFNNYAHSVAQKMVTGTLVGQKATWRAAAAESMHGKDIYKQIMKDLSGTGIGGVVDQIIYNNHFLIKTVPLSVALRMSRLAQKMTLEGLRPE